MQSKIFMDLSGKTPHVQKYLVEIQSLENWIKSTKNIDDYTHVFNRGKQFLHKSFREHLKCKIYIYIYIRLKIKPNSVRIRFQSCQIFVRPSTGFEPTPLIHCSTIRLTLRPASQTTRPHPLPKKGASIIVVLPFLVRQIQRQA